MAEVRLAAVVPATNEPPTLERCLAAIEAAADGPDELVVVDGPRGAGPAEARNAGATRTGADVVVFVDADVLVRIDAFARIREHFRREPGLTAVFGAYDDMVATTRLTAGFRNLMHHHVHARSAGPATTFWAGIGAVRREAFESVGGFDTDRFPRPSIEDVELGLRLADAGARILLDPQVRGTHLKDWTFRQMVETDFSARGVPWVRLLVERREVPTTLNLGWRERASAAASVGAVLLLARGRPVLASAAALSLVPLNAPFYCLLRRRLGDAATLASVPLHVAHHVAGAAAIPVGLATGLRGRRET